MELRADRITKQYKNKIAVDRMSFTLTEGVTGLLGANGAGKTTLMRILCGILVPDGGTVTCDGMDAAAEEYREILGYLPQEFGCYPGFTGRDFLLYMAAVKGLRKSDALKKTEELIGMTGLKEAARKKVRTYSGGMKQRLGIAQALLNDPKILILDEPTRGIDVNAKSEFYTLMNEFVDRGGTIVMVSSELPEVLGVSDRIIVMCEGRVTGELSREEATEQKIMYLASQID